ncbi:hypothetical protein GCM10010439_14430 [Actinocorallia aurantiaca]|uniref:Ricin B lectin domain-containing protein n=2 Tax=Actinocorallia aurantiaca TaxID=46204 RepID=A0ABN3U0A8_9ACTN
MLAGALTAFSSVGTPAFASSYSIMLKNHATGDCLTRSEKSTVTSVYALPCSDSPNQRWIVEQCTTLFCGTVRIVNAVDQRCVTGAGPEHKTFIGLYQCSSIGSRDVWLPYSSSEKDAFLFMSSFYSKQCLEQSGTNTFLVPCTASDSQFWEIAHP